jgi:hypothetical protein
LAQILNVLISTSLRRVWRCCGLGFSARDQISGWYHCSAATSIKGRRKVVELHIPIITTTMKTFQATAATFLSLLITTIAAQSVAAQTSTFKIVDSKEGTCASGSGVNKDSENGFPVVMWVYFDCIHNLAVNDWNYILYRAVCNNSPQETWQMGQPNEAAQIRLDNSNLCITSGTGNRDSQ